MFLSQIPVHTAVPNNPPPPSLSPASIRTVEREYQPSLPPSSESSSSSSSREGIGERSKGVVQEWTPEGGGCRLSYCRDRFESRFHAALAEIIQSGMPGFRGIESFWKGETRHPARQILYRRFTVRMKSEFRGEGG